MSEQLGVDALDDLLLGSQLGVLTAASTFTGSMERWVSRCLAEHGPVTVLHPDEVDDTFGADEFACCVGMVGSLAAMYEMPPGGDECIEAFDELGRMIGRRPHCVAPLNAAGVNAMIAVAAAALNGVPLLDCDGQGRVFPLIDQTTFALAGLDAAPLVGVGPWGDVVTVRSPAGRAERLERFGLAGAGGWLMTALYPAPVRELAAAGIPGSLSRCRTVGAILRSGRGHIGALLARELGGRLVGRGRVAGIAEQAEHGVATVQPAQPVAVVIDRADRPGSEILIEVRNEAVLVLVDGAVVATTPDSICLVDPLRRRAVDLLDLNEGDAVDVFVLPADERWHTDAGIRLAGPRAFGVPLRHHEERR